MKVKIGFDYLTSELPAEEARKKDEQDFNLTITDSGEGTVYTTFYIIEGAEADIQRFIEHFELQELVID